MFADYNNQQNVFKIFKQITFLIIANIYFALFTLCFSFFFPYICLQRLTSLPKPRVTLKFQIFIPLPPRQCIKQDDVLGPYSFQYFYSTFSICNKKLLSLYIINLLHKTFSKTNFINFWIFIVI
uniref:Transmembrane protein n=1 Tax=Octopus bimaculoides TaxID=37653 RepID=A0A0L8IDC3_OCTBM